MATFSELTECSICYDVFVEPLLLTCHHTFCQRFVSKLTQNEAIKCPKCKTEMLVVDLRPDFWLASFLDALALQADELTRSSRPSVASSNTNHSSSSAAAATAASSAHQPRQNDVRRCATELTLTSYLRDVGRRCDAVVTQLTQRDADVASAKQRQAAALAKCNVTRRQCHADVDRHFDELCERLRSALTSQRCAAYARDMRQQHWQLAKIRAQHRDIKQAPRNSTAKLRKSVEEAKALLETTQQLLLQPADACRICDVIFVERNKLWRASDATRVSFNNIKIV